MPNIGVDTLIRPPQVHKEQGWSPGAFHAGMRCISHTVGTVCKSEHTRSYGSKSGDGPGDSVAVGNIGDV